MTIQQVSVFVPNRTGMIADVVDLVGKLNVNIRALSIADTADFGILRLIVDNTEKLTAALKEAGYIASVNAVLAAQMPDAPGGLAAVLHALAESGLAVEYAYAFVTRQAENAFVVLRVNDNDAANALLTEKGFTLIDDEQLSKI